MTNYKLTNKADAEIERLYEHSILNFGVTVARRYLNGLHESFATIAENPSWGNDYGHIEQGLKRYEYRSHSYYFKELEDRVLIIRVLGNRQDPMRAFFPLDHDR